jgi:phosphatidylinositol alpha 1,6-mannosyltransferase
LQLRDLDFLLGRKITIVIIGGGPSENFTKNFKQAIFLGHLSGMDLSTAMASLDLLITTGENETFCQVIQEGMACGLPVISPNVGGPRDLISHGYNGLHYEASQANSLRLEVLKILSQDSLRSRLSKNALKTVGKS